MNNNIYGYIRVSTVAQHDDRQWVAMEKFGIPRERIFADRQSGKDFNRPAYHKLITQLDQGDTLVIKSLDRLGRNYDEMIKQLDIITRQKEVALVVLDLPLLDTRNRYGNDLTGKLISNLVIQLFSYVAQTEREMNIKRTSEGIAAAKARGVRFGRKALVRPPEFDDVRQQWKDGVISEREAAKMLGVSRPTFHKWAYARNHK
ncbi:MAG: recombinase family protein [Selenomonas sp.]|uniref:recombinase family protein n=1 Tax=Selenomonas sp. TaxID=2053611 RepID=UPI0025EFB55C|nr:recombinase family protein [Selenomonas sp.]MCR5439830.1 recombinase family protein [Selenomonas sp.]